MAYVVIAFFISTFVHMPVQNGDTIRIHYTGTLEDGSVFDSSDGREPLQFTVGSGQVIPGFDNAVLGLEPGDKRTVTIPSDEAYGEFRDEMVIQVGRDQLPEDLDPEIGDELQLTTPDGHPIPVLVTAMNDESLTLDANHPLAGEDLTFAIRLEEIV